MKFLFPAQILTLSFVMLTASCGEKAPQLKTTEVDESNFFGEEPATLKLDSLKNEMAEGETDFLKSFADDNIPWQKWDHSLLEKAKKCQLPIFAFVGSALGKASKSVASEIDGTEKIRALLSKGAVCTIIDTHAYPEIGKLSYHLSNEINRSTAFPMVIWLSHEGSPLAWIPVGSASGQDLAKVVNSASAMVNDIWKKSSRYAVENSRHDNTARQLRFEFPNRDKEVKTSRDEIFRQATRQLSSLYSSADNDLDYIGGLIPTGTLEILAIGSQSKLLTDEIRIRCKTAAEDVASQLMAGSLRDPLDQAYFYARQTNDWSLPSFSKNIDSQARIAAMFLKLGSILNNQTFTAEGLNLIDKIETEWLANNTVTISPLGKETLSEGLLWSMKVLQAILTEEELAVAKTAFSLKSGGNIPITVDPLGTYFKLNSLRNVTSLKKLAEAHNTSEEEVTALLKVITEKLLKHRQEKVKFISESVITITDLAMILKAQIARSVISQNEKDLQSALTTADRILADYWNPESGLLRINHDEKTIKARAKDYAVASLALILLYQHTLDLKWLTSSSAIMDHAMTTFSGDFKLLAETPPTERIIPLRQHDISMIFGDSTLGFADLTISRLSALTGKESYKGLLNNQIEAAAPGLASSVVNHTDFIGSCALGETPLIAAIQGEINTPEGREFLALLNTAPYLPFLTIRPATSSDNLVSLPTLPDTKGQNSVVLIRGKKILGQAATAAELSELLNKIISIRQ